MRLPNSDSLARPPPSIRILPSRLSGRRQIAGFDAVMRLCARPIGRSLMVHSRQAGSDTIEHASQESDSICHRDRRPACRFGRWDLSDEGRSERVSNHL